MGTAKNIYFASDLHLGIPNREASLVASLRFVIPESLSTGTSATTTCGFLTISRKNWE